MESTLSVMRADSIASLFMNEVVSDEGRALRARAEGPLYV